MQRINHLNSRNPFVDRCRTGVSNPRHNGGRPDRFSFCRGPRRGGAAATIAFRGIEDGGTRGRIGRTEKPKKETKRKERTKNNKNVRQGSRGERRWRVSRKPIKLDVCSGNGCCRRRCRVFFFVPDGRVLFNLFRELLRGFEDAPSTCGLKDAPRRVISVFVCQIFLDRCPFPASLVIWGLGWLEWSQTFA